MPKGHKRKQKEGDDDDEESEEEEKGPAKKKKVGEEKVYKEKKSIPTDKKKAKKPEGHMEVHTGEEYKSGAGKGDVWKKGQKFEPFAYVRFNPKVSFIRKSIE